MGSLENSVLVLSKPDELSLSISENTYLRQTKFRLPPVTSTRWDEPITTISKSHYDLLLQNIFSAQYNKISDKIVIITSKSSHYTS
jgi:hypothetical protein